MPKKLRKMLGDRDAPCTQSLLSLIDTQSKATICKWCIDYAEAIVLPIFEKRCPDDNRPRNALNAARDYLGSKIKFPEAKTSSGTLPPAERMTTPSRRRRRGR